MACSTDTTWEQWTHNLEDQKDEVLALVSIFEGTEKFRVLFSPEDENGQYTLQVDVPVHIGENGTLIKAWLPCEKETAVPDMNVKEVPAGVRPQFERSESGRRWHSSFRVNYLPPLCLQVVFPFNYPSDGPPLFTLSAPWLDVVKLTSLCKELDILWTESKGSPILYTWVDWLENNTLSNLGLETGPVLITQQEECDDMCECNDERAVLMGFNLQENLVNLLRYNLQQEWNAFQKNPQSCGICFEEKAGIEFFRIQDCQHHFCHGCMKAYCDFHVGQGTVQQLLCPESDCKQTIPPNILQSVLEEQNYNRWEKLLLQHTLGAMGDVVWCPRCNSVVIREEEEILQLAHCTNCWYSFCTNCQDAWHQGSKCKTIEDRIAELEKESIDDDDDYSEATVQRRRRIQKQLEYLSCLTVKRTTKPCPKCRTPIEKNYGCNKITCKCGTSMCWVCARAIKGYEHFSDSSCVLFPGQHMYAPAPMPRWERPLNREAERVREAMYDPRAVGRIFPCPRCRQRNLRDKRNNHIRCWACRANVCFACRSVIEGVVSCHFRANMPCRQHSD